MADDEGRADAAAPPPKRARTESAPPPLCAAHHSSRGRKQHLEDVVVTCHSLPNAEALAWYAVLDGHGGRACAEWAAARLPELLSEHVGRVHASAEVKEAIRSAMLEMLEDEEGSAPGSAPLLHAVSNYDGPPGGSALVHAVVEHFSAKFGWDTVFGPFFLFGRYGSDITLEDVQLTGKLTEYYLGRGGAILNFDMEHYAFKDLTLSLFPDRQQPATAPDLSACRVVATGDPVEFGAGSARWLGQRPPVERISLQPEGHGH